MDRREEIASQSRYKQDLEKELQQNSEIDDSKNYVVEDGKRFRVPYRIIKKVVFEEVDKSELKTQEYSARLQYRLLLLEPVIKAWVEFNKRKITVIYNPASADNIKEKMSLDELIEFLAKEGVHIDRAKMHEEDYDYYKELYTYAYSPKSIREHPPYGYTQEQWKKMKPEWEIKQKKYAEKKAQQQREYQKWYEQQHPEVDWSNGNVQQDQSNQQEKANNRKSLLSRMFGKKF
ncbi:MAG: hypothetical protein QXN59_01280 [Candidatus Micrarchaeaceae archaeon]